MNTRVLAVLAACAAFFAAGAIADEHPSEHPKEAATGANAEHPAEGAKTQAACTMEDVAGAAENWAAEAAKAGGMKIYDKVQKKKLDLAFMKVHRERLSKVGKDRYFVCADFKAADGTVYDVDLFMKGKDKEHLKADGKPIIHKINGEPRYDWVEKNGVWKTVARKKAMKP